MECNIPEDKEDVEESNNINNDDMIDDNSSTEAFDVVKII